MQETDFSLQVSEVVHARLLVEFGQSSDDVISALVVDEGEYLVYVAGSQDLIFVLIAEVTELVGELLQHLVLEAIANVLAK